jgi:hypothetical protein
VLRDGALTSVYDHCVEEQPLSARDSSQGLTVELDEVERFVERTRGASPAFIRELLRKAALFAADEGDELVVRDRHLDEALHDLVVEGGELTRSLLGGPPA